MKKEIFTILFITIFTAIINNCRSDNKIERQLNYNDSLYIEKNEDGSLLVRSAICDAAIKYIFDREWNNFCENYALYKSGFFTLKGRKPSLHFFIICLTNTTQDLLIPESFYITQNNENYHALKINDFNNKFISPVYKNYNTKKLFQTKRVISNKIQSELSQINYETDTIRYNFNFILPGNTIILVKAFNKKIITSENFKLNIILKNKNKKKTIDFDIKFSDYRTNGKYFRNLINKQGY